MVTRNSVSFNEKLQPAVHDLRVNIANNAINELESFDEAFRQKMSSPANT